MPLTRMMVLSRRFRLRAELNIMKENMWRYLEDETEKRKNKCEGAKREAFLKQEQK